MSPDTRRAHRCQGGRCRPDTIRCDRDRRRSRCHRNPRASHRRSRCPLAHTHPVPIVEPEAAGAATAKTPDVSASEATRETPVLPRMIEVIARVVSAGVMADPGFAVDVGSVRVARLVAEIAIGLGRARRALWAAGPLLGNGRMRLRRRDAVRTPERQRRAMSQELTERLSSIPPDALRNLSVLPLFLERTSPTTLT